MAIPHSAPHVALLLLIALASGSAASETKAWQDAPPPNATSASASVGFRIVIGEVLRFDQQAQRRRATAPRSTRVVTTQEGRRLVTIARP